MLPMAAALALAVLLAFAAAADDRCRSAMQAIDRYVDDQAAMAAQFNIVRDFALWHLTDANATRLSAAALRVLADAEQLAARGDALLDAAISACSMSPTNDIVASTRAEISATLQIVYLSRARIRRTGQIP